MRLTLILCSMLAAISFLPAEEKTQPSNFTPEINDAHSYLKPILNHLRNEKQDPSIHLSPMTDPKYQPALVAVFSEIPGKPPYRLEYQRLLQKNPNQYTSAIEQQTTLNTIRESDLKTPFGLLLPLKDYLPGERVSWRISSVTGEVLKEFTCCPNPLVIKTSTGEVLMKAALISPWEPTCYVLSFPTSTEDIEFVFSVGAKQSKGKIEKGGERITTFEPALDGVFGGMSNIELTIKDQSYSLELPWGNRLKKGIILQGWKNTLH